VNYDEDGRRDINPVYPSKIVTFFRHPVTKENMALLQEVLFQSEKQEERDSQLFQHWTLQSRVNRTTKTHDAVLKAVPIQVLSDRIYVIDSNPLGGFSRNDPADFDILVVKFVREQWPLSFLNSPAFLASYDWS